MLGVDTNVLIRLLVAEVEWVLRSRYEMTRAEIVSVFRALLAAAEFTFEHESALEEALYFWQDAPTGFVDCLIAVHNRRLGCSGTATFDSKALRVPGFVQA